MPAPAELTSVSGVLAVGTCAAAIAVVVAVDGTKLFTSGKSPPQPSAPARVTLYPALGPYTPPPPQKIEAASAGFSEPAEPVPSGDRVPKARICLNALMPP